MIAHRLSTVSDADKIYVMKQGRLIEEGTHLLARRGLYAQYCELQFEDVQKLTVPSPSLANEALQMIKRLINAEFSRKIVTWLAAQYIRFVSLSGRWRIVGESSTDGLLEKGELSSSHSGTVA